MLFIFVTADTFHSERSSLKDEAPRNIPLTSVAADSSHAEMLGLHVSLLLNSQRISVTALTSHNEMSPCAKMAAASSLHHRSTASCRADLLSKMPVCAFAASVQKLKNSVSRIYGCARGKSRDRPEAIVVRRAAPQCTKPRIHRRPCNRFSSAGSCFSS